MTEREREIACHRPVVRRFTQLDPNMTHAMVAYQEEKADHLCSACYESKLLGILRGIEAIEWLTMPWFFPLSIFFEKLFSRSDSDVELFLHFLSNYEKKDKSWWRVELHLADDSTLEQATMVTQALANNGSVGLIWGIGVTSSPQQPCVCEVFALPIFQQLESMLRVVAATRRDVEHLHRVDEMFAAAPNLITYKSSFEISAPNDYSTAERLGELFKSSESISKALIRDAPMDKETAIVYAEWFSRLLSDPDALQRIDQISIAHRVKLDFRNPTDLVVSLDKHVLQDPQRLQVWEALVLRITGLQRLVLPGLVWSSIPTLIQNNQQSLSSLQLNVEFIRMVPDYLSVAPNLTELTVEGNGDADYNDLAIDPEELEKVRRAFEVNTSLETIELPNYDEFENFYDYGDRNVANKAALKAVLALENGSLSVAAIPYIMKRIFGFEKDIAQEIAAVHVQNLRREALKMACAHSNGGEANI